MASSEEYQPFEVDLDLSSGESWDGEDRPLVPIGSYKVEIVGVKNLGKRIEIKFKVVHGEHVGAFVWNNYQIDNETGLKRLRCLMVACGASLGRVNSNELMGALLYVDVIHNDGKAKTDDLGNPKPVKTFANVQRERSLQSEEGGNGTAEVEKPPITRTAEASTEPANNGGARRTGTRRT